LDGAYAFNTGNASTSGPSEVLCNVNGSNQITNDVWYQYFPVGCSGTATASVCGASFNTRIAVYTDCPEYGGTIIACNDDFCGTGSSVSFPASEGNFYVIRVGGYNGATGTGTLTVGCSGASPCPADIAPPGGNGQVNIDDLTQIILNWGTNDANADINDDGNVNIDDLTAVILGWGPC
ncbi:MAG TPA: hypothetical protein VG711_02180, partial [Phycisphaerales bacterium]|nr:hypothetical protein [Phycisphaerales bacterium]